MVLKLILYTLTSNWICKFSILFSIYIFYSTYKENLSNTSELLEFAIISFILTTLMFDSGGDAVGRNWMLIKNNWEFFMKWWCGLQNCSAQEYFLMKGVNKADTWYMTLHFNFAWKIWMNKPTCWKWKLYLQIICQTEKTSPDNLLVIWNLV